MKKFKAFIVSKHNDGTFHYSIGEKNISELPKGDLLIKVKYSTSFSRSIDVIISLFTLYKILFSSA